MAQILVVSEREQTYCLLGSSHRMGIVSERSTLNWLGPCHTSCESSNGSGGSATALGRYQIPAYLLTKANKAKECNSA